MINWLLESDLFDEGLSDFIQEIRNQGHNVKVLSDKAYWDTDFVDLFDEKSCVVYYGSLEMGYQVRRKSKWIPGLYSSIENYDCTKYYPLFGDYLLNSEYMMVPFGDLQRKKEWLFDHLGIDDAIFIRPNKGNKVFTGKLVYKERFEKDLDLLGFYNVQPNELCVVCRPYNIGREFRFVIVDNKWVAGSQYKFTNVHEKQIPINTDYLSHRNAIALVEEVLSNVEYSPDRAWTLDICQTSKETCKVLEVGCFSCAGLYACEYESIIREVSRVALEDWEDFYDVLDK